MNLTEYPSTSPTDRIFFDEHFKTFRLYAGNSLYAMCISSELLLEHLYWGKTLHPGYDLRYLSKSSRSTHFSTLEAAADIFEVASQVVPSESFADIQKTWKDMKSMKGTVDDIEAFQKRRLENYAWRMMSLKKVRSPRVPGPASADSEDGRFGGLDVHIVDVEPDIASSRRRGGGSNNSLNNSVFSGGGGGRRRSTSTPMLYDQNASNSLDTEPPLGRSIIAAASKKGHTVFRNFSSDQMDPLEARLGIQRVTSMEQLTSVPQSPFLGSCLLNGGPRHSFDRDEGLIGKGSLCVEYSDQGTGDFRTPSFVVADNFNGSSISPLKYRKHQIFKGKLPMPNDLPGIRSDGKDASTLIVTLADSGSGLEVDLIYVVMHDYDVITRRVDFRNIDTRGGQLAGVTELNSDDTPSAASSSVFISVNGKVVQKASSLTLDFESPSLPFHLVQLSGSWGRERSVEVTELTHGMQSFGSMRGVSGHQHNPFAVITVGTPNETHGEVKGFSLVYSGNFLVEAELGETGRLRFNMGIHPSGLQWNLKPGKVFSTPECVLVRSGSGLGGMSRMLHRLFLDKLLPRCAWAEKNPPVLLNTWEAKYFGVNHQNVVDMAKQAVKIGVNLLVLDDGWFGKRNDDMSSLGDWQPNETKFPQGLKRLVQEINEAGCKFGLWFEPEMMSADSNLFKAHSDWYLHVPGRPRQIGRNQMVLDMSRSEVRDCIFNQMSDILNSANVEYIKWDMNRPLTEVYSSVNASCSGAASSLHSESVWQAETGHRYVLGLYELQSRITKAFPHVLLENCASGGGRFDPGMLFFSPQIWCSDNTDAIARMKIQYGTSLAYPARCVGAHISAVPNHITGNTTRLRTRALVAMCGTFGFELDVGLATVAEKTQFLRYVELYRELAPVIWWGDLFRLWDPFKVNLAAWMYVSRDKSYAVVFAFSVNSDHWSNLVPRLQLQGLLPDAEYEINEPLPNNVAQNIGNLRIIETEAPMYQLGVNGVCFTGEILMSAGLPVKFYTLDDSVMFTLSRVCTY